MTDVQRHPFQAALAAIATLAILTGAAFVLTNESDEVPVTIGEEHARRVALGSAPYDAAPCPARITLDEISDHLPDLTDAVSVRLCADFTTTLRFEEFPPTRAEIVATPQQEGLVRGIELLRDELSMSQPFDAARCAMYDSFFQTYGIVVTFRDAPSVIVRAARCNPLHVPGFGAPIDAGDLHDQFLSALAFQRVRYSYSHHVAAPVNCNLFGLESPIRPFNEKVVAAATCGRYDEVTGRRPTSPIDADALARLQRAWANARPYDRWPFSREDACTETDDEMPSMVVRTHHGDTVQLSESPCGYLYLRTWERGRAWQLPITLASLQ
jgi:hypothetical protein